MAGRVGEEEWMEKGSWPENAGIVDYLIWMIYVQIKA